MRRIDDPAAIARDDHRRDRGACRAVVGPWGGDAALHAVAAPLALTPRRRCPAARLAIPARAGSVRASLLWAAGVPARSRPGPARYAPAWAPEVTDGARFSPALGAAIVALVRPRARRHTLDDRPRPAVR